MNKKNIFTILLFSFSLVSLSAKGADSATAQASFPIVEFGFRFMPTVSSFSMESSGGGTIEGQVTFGYGIGGMLAFNFSRHIGIQGEIIYNALSQKYKDRDLDRQIKVRYINIPLFLSLNSGKGNLINMNLVVGPQFGYNVGSSFSSSGGSSTDTITYVQATKRSDFGFAYGTGMEFMLNEKRTIRMDIGYRGVFGLVNIADNSAGDGGAYVVEKAKVRTNAIYLGVSFVF